MIYATQIPSERVEVCKLIESEYVGYKLQKVWYVWSGAEENNRWTSKAKHFKKHFADIHFEYFR